MSGSYDQTPNHPQATFEFGRPTRAYPTVPDGHNQPDVTRLTGMVQDRIARDDVLRPALSEQIPRPRSRSFRGAGEPRLGSNAACAWHGKSQLARGRFSIGSTFGPAPEMTGTRPRCRHGRQRRCCGCGWRASAAGRSQPRLARDPAPAALRAPLGTLPAAVIATAGCSASLASVMPVPRVSPHRPANRAAWRPDRAHGT
jgi:hypothetical protein